MNNKKKLLIINGAQFGHSSGHHFYCKYLIDSFSIQYICYDRGLKRFTLDGVEVEYVTFDGSKFSRNLRFLIECIKQSIIYKPDILFVTYFNLGFLLAVFCKSKKRVLDIRTGTLNEKRIFRDVGDFTIFFQSLFFSRIVILSDSMRHKLLLSVKKSIVVPLGAEIIVEKNHDFFGIRLLYVGALNGRKIAETIKGIQLFLKKNGTKTVKLSYTIIGFGSEQEVLKIRETISEYRLADIVNFEGRKAHDELVPYFEQANIGIVYIPRTEWFDCQPATKLFEYLLSGMPVIATDTYENRLIINKINGILIKDTPEDFCTGLERIFENRNSFKSSAVRKSVENNTWENIVNTNLKPYLLKLL